MTAKFDIPHIVISRLKEKKRLLEDNNPKHKEIKTALIIDGGAMRAVYASGVVAAFKELGFENVFDLVIAVSSGTIIASYFLSGQAEVVPEVFYTYLANKKFINIYKLHPSKVIGFDYIDNVFRNTKKIN